MSPIERAVIYLLIVFATVALTLIVAIIRKGRQEGWFISQKSHAKLVFVSCERCDGCGVTLMGEIIPKQYRSYLSTRDGLVINGKIANTESCSLCRGLGGFWIDKVTRKIQNPVQDRKLTDSWDY